MGYKLNKKKFLRAVTLLCIVIVSMVMIFNMVLSSPKEDLPEIPPLPSTSKAPTPSSIATGELDGINIVVDAGHGGFDVGTSGGTTQVREDDINLAISLFLEEELKDMGANVIMTRSDENAVGATKNEDMENRRKIIEEPENHIAVSIHQNWYGDPEVAGPQVFFSQGSQQGQEFAQVLQDSLNSQFLEDNPRVASGADYYILRSGTIPCAIIECGFLSNLEEELLLSDDTYQRKVAKTIADGILDYHDTKIITE